MRKPILSLILLLTSLIVNSQKYVGTRELKPGTFGGEPEVKQKTKVNKSSDFDTQLGGFRNEFGVFRGIDATGFY